MRKRFAMLAAVLFSVIAAAFPAYAWAGVTNATVTCDDLKSGTFDVAVASWDSEQDYIKDLSGSAVVLLDEGVQGLADTGELVYNIQTWGTCDECRNITLKTSVNFYDENGNSIGSWSDGVISDYDTFRQEHTLGNSAFVPKGTARIEVAASNHVGTRSDLELTCTFSLSSTANMDPTSHGNSFIATVKGDDFYDTSVDATSTQVFSFDYLRDETVYASDVDLYATVYLDSSAQGIANEGYLTYVMSFTSKCGECRTMENDATVRCYNASDQELSSGQWNVAEDDYGTYPQSKEFRSGQVLIPEGTAYLKVQCSNETGTASHLGLYGSLAVTSLKDANYWYDNEASADSADEGQTTVVAYETYDANGEGKGELLFTDVFAGMSKRVSADSRAELCKSALMNQNVLFNWSQLAYDVFKTEGAYWDHADIGFDAAFGAGHYNDLVYQFTHQTDGRTDVGGSSASAWTSSSGLRQASTWDEVLADATADLSQQRKRLSSRALGNITSDDLVKAHDVAGALGDKYANPVDWEAYNDLIFYTYANATDQRGGEQFYYYDSFILAFYDFEYVPVVDGAVYTTSIDPQTGAKEVSQCTVNDTAAESSIEADYSSTESSTAENSITSASAVSTSSTLGMDVEAIAKFGVSELVGIEFSFGASYSWTTEQAYSFEESKAKSETVEESFGSASETPLPPYTTGFVHTTSTVAEMRHEYDCPLSVQYKVLIIGLNGKYYDDGAAIMDMHENNTFVAGIGYNDQNGFSRSAADVLRNDVNSSKLDLGAISTCAAPESKLYDGDANLKTGSALLSYLGTHMPMTSEDAVYVDTTNHVQYSTEVYASRPLNYTAITHVSSNVLGEKNSIYLTPGQEYNLTNNVGVGGFNDAGAEYFDFVAAEGYYALYDGNGEPLSEDVAYLKKNAVNGNTYLVITATSNERFHVVYHINDGLYSYVNGSDQTYGLDEHGFGNGYVNDEDLTKRATLDVRVEAPNSIEAPSVQNPSEGDGSEASGSSESPDSESAANDAVTGDAATPESGAAVDEATAPVEDASVAEDVAADAATPDDGAADAEASSSAEALSSISARMNLAWDTLVATYGINEAGVDPLAPVDEGHFFGLLYVSWCMYHDASPQADPREDFEAFSEEALAWARERSITDLYAEGGTYADAVRIIVNAIANAELG